MIDKNEIKNTLDLKFLKKTGKQKIHQTENFSKVKLKIICISAHFVSKQVK